MQMIVAAKNLVKVFLIGPLMSYGVDLTHPISNGIVNPAKEFAFAVTLRRGSWPLRAFPTSGMHIALTTTVPFDFANVCATQLFTYQQLNLLSAKHWL
jgi:hypothetical protein